MGRDVPNCDEYHVLWRNLYTSIDFPDPHKFSRSLNRGILITKDDFQSLSKRQRISVQGIVQGVGFRPFVYGLANELGLSGSVLNDECGVTIEIEGPSPLLESFVDAVINRAPPLSRVDFLNTEPVPLKGDLKFVILASQAGNTRNALV